MNAHLVASRRSVDGVLHSDAAFQPAEGDWWACEFPERPTTERTLFSTGCKACVVALGATAVDSQDETWVQAYNNLRRAHELPPLPTHVARLAAIFG